MSTNLKDSMAVGDLELGSICDRDLVDDQGVLLVGRGVEITPTLIAKLRARGVDLLHSRTANSRRTSPAPRRRRRTSAAPLGEVQSTTYDPAQIQHIRKLFAAGERAVSELAGSVQRKGGVDLDAAAPHVDSYIEALTEDPDPVVANALVYQEDLKLARRCVQFSILSLAISEHMEVIGQTKQDIGVAALVHDWGLFDFPPNARFPHQLTTAEERERYQLHPIAAEAMLDTAGSASPTIKQMVAQVHELLDGTGFPRRLKADAIPLGARILAVADAFLTMTCPPHGCTRVVPCDAIAYLISAASRGEYSANAVTGLLRTVTMYPIGSVVELSDMSQVRVVRTNGGEYGYPIVETLSPPTQVIDLKSSELFITRPVVSREHGEVRMTDAYGEIEQKLNESS